MPLSCADVADRGLVDPALWERVQAIALALFERGRACGEHSGLILADTKYEFGLTTDGELLLIDEVHTPDSSRWWVASTYDERVAAGAEPESLDKEVVRRALADIGYTGEGPVPELSPAVWSATTDRYIDAYERLTGTRFVPGSYPAGPRIRRRPRWTGDLPTMTSLHVTSHARAVHPSTTTRPKEECGVLGISTPARRRGRPAHVLRVCSRCSTAARRRPASP